MKIILALAYVLALFLCVSFVTAQPQAGTPTATANSTSTGNGTSTTGTTTKTSQTSQQQSSTTGAPTDQCGSGSCSGDDKCCHAHYSLAQCYNISSQHCIRNPANERVLCPLNRKACGSSCFDPRQYYCDYDHIIQKAVPTTLSTIGTGNFGATTGDPHGVCGVAACTKGAICCRSHYVSPQCYDTKKQHCIDNPQGYRVLCNNKLKACNQSCYDPRQYYCVVNKLEQLQTSVATHGATSSEEPATTVSTATTRAPTSTSTATTRAPTSTSTASTAAPTATSTTRVTTTTTTTSPTTTVNATTTQATTVAGSTTKRSSASTFSICFALVALIAFFAY